jgi:D-glycero-alpha-D-manno-heptose-7-phosphate kinase
MIISQTPLRMSFAGGGSDLPAFYRKYGGAVVSTAIDKFVYVGVNKKFDDSIRISYSRTEEVATVDEIEHRLVREALRMLSIPGGLEITSIADIPSRGTGMGSSSSFAVGLLHALHAYRQEYVSPETLGDESSRLEIDLCGELIGKQDQYAAACGGFNFIEFHRDNAVSVCPIICGREMIAELQRWLMMFYTGMTRRAGTILNHQSASMENDCGKQEAVRAMVALAHRLRDELQRERLESIGDILRENWELKKRLAEGISNPEIEGWYERALNRGAIGGKLLGAGAGGFLLFFVPPHRQNAVRDALSDLRQIPFGFERQGSRIILFQP